MTIRFGYCPPNPGPNARTGCTWYSDINAAIDNYDGKSTIWMKIGGSRYTQISYSKLLELKTIFI